MTTGALCQRIIDKMPKILELIASENETGDDPRPEIVRHVKEIADFKVMSQSQIQRAFNRVAANIKQLEASLASLPGEKRLVRVDGLYHGMGWWWSWAKEKPRRTKADRKLLAARVALDLMIDYGDHAPTLAKDGKFTQLAELLYSTATGKRDGLARSCKQCFDVYKDGGFDFYSRKPRRPGRRASNWLWKLMRASTPKDRSSAILEWSPLEEKWIPLKEKWPPLEAVVHKALGLKIVSPKI